MLGQKAHAACRRDEKTNDDPNRCFLSANGKSYQRVKAAIKWLIICLFKIMHCLRLRQEFHAKIGSERHRKTHEASNGRQALGELARVCPDLVLCDISMPELDGYGVLDALQERGPDYAEIPFVFLSALADPRHIVDGKRLGADDYLVKPIDYDLLLATIEARLRQIGRIRSARPLRPAGSNFTKLAEAYGLTPVEIRIT